MNRPVGKSPHGPLRVGIGGPVGAGKTALMDQLCKRMRDRWSIAAITNDIYTREDAEFLMRSQALPLERIIGVETGGCPHTAIREDASINLAAVDEMVARFPDLDVILIESGGDNLSATFSPELADLTLYVIDVCAGDKIPRKGGPGSHALGPPHHQQDRPRALRRGLARSDGPRLAADARRPPVPVRADPQRRGDPRDHRLHRDRRRPDRVIAPPLADPAAARPLHRLRRLAHDRRRRPAAAPASSSGPTTRRWRPGSMAAPATRTAPTRRFFGPFRRMVRAALDPGAAGRAMDRHHHPHRRAPARDRRGRCRADHGARPRRPVAAGARARHRSRRHGRLPGHAHGLCAAARAAGARPRPRPDAPRDHRHPLPGLCAARARGRARLRAALRHRHALLGQHHDRELPPLPRPARRRPGTITYLEFRADYRVELRLRRTGASG